MPPRVADCPGIRGLQPKWRRLYCPGHPTLPKEAGVSFSRQASTLLVAQSGIFCPRLQLDFNAGHETVYDEDFSGQREQAGILGVAEFGHELASLEGKGANRLHSDAFM